MKSENYITIQGWMRNELNLKGNNLLVYAVIYGFSQDGNNEFTGSLQYLADWCGATKQGVQKNLKNLLEQGLIKKREFEKNGLKFCAYSCIPYNSVVRGIQLSCTNNIANKQDNKLFISKDINNSENPSVQHFLDTYHKYCTELPKVRRLTDKRKNAILKMRNKFTWDEIIQVFQNVKESDFLNGRNDRGWKADLDFILREDKFVAILEGKYNSKKRSNKKLEVFGESDEVSNEQYTEEELAELEKLNAERRANGQRTHF